MTTLLEVIIYLASGLGLLAALVTLVFAGAVVWIAAGEPDANGDVERDAGGRDHEIARPSIPFSFTSNRTPNHD